MSINTENIFTTLVLQRVNENVYFLLLIVINNYPFVYKEGEKHFCKIERKNERDDMLSKYPFFLQVKKHKLKF